jgi:hypothetical protein
VRDFLGSTGCQPVLSETTQESRGVKINSGEPRGHHCEQHKEFQATAMRQEDKIQALTAALKKQAAQIEKVSAQIEMKERTTQIVDNE